MSRITADIETKINGKLEKVTDAAVGFNSLAVKGVSKWVKLNMKPHPTFDFPILALDAKCLLGGYEGN